jgi:hypothetical protein
VFLGFKIRGRGTNGGVLLAKEGRISESLKQGRLSVIQSGVPGVWRERQRFLGFEELDQGLMKGAAIGFLIFHLIMRGKLCCIFIRLIFHLPDKLVGH